MFASKSAIASASSPNAGSNVFSGNEAPPATLSLAESRKEEREEGRRGVVGRDVREREVDRFLLESRCSLEAMMKIRVW